MHHIDYLVNSFCIVRMESFVSLSVDIQLNSNTCIHSVVFLHNLTTIILCMYVCMYHAHRFISSYKPFSLFLLCVCFIRDNFDFCIDMIL